MIISDTSPLKLLPSELNPEQSAFLDGIRYSVQMIDLAYARLRQTLLHLAIEDHAEGWSFTAAFHDAWSIVDSVHRLRQLLHKMPRVKKSTPKFQLFLRKTAVAKELRNRIQHLGDGLKDISTAGSPVWGTLKWIAVVDTSPLRLNLCSISAGRILSGVTLLPDAFHETFEPPVDYVELEAQPFKLSLSETCREIEKLVRGLEKSLEKQFAGLPTQAADIVIRTTVVFEDAEVREVAAPEQP